MSNHNHEKEGTKNGMFIVFVLLVIGALTLAHIFI